MSSGASSSSSPPPAGAGDGYWAAREEAAARLEAMAARPLGEDELSAEQLETNNQLQEDEVMYRAPQLLVACEFVCFTSAHPKSVDYIWSCRD